MKITIKKWEHYNPRKDITRPHWFRLENNIFDDPDFYNFTNSELLGWVYILSVASKKNFTQVLVNFEHAERVGRIKMGDLISAINKLEQLQIITVDERERDVDVTDPYGNVTSAYATNRTEQTEQNRTDRTIRSHSGAIVTSLDKISRTKNTPTSETWAAYKAAYFSRYGADPVRNATVNAQLSQFVKRLGESEAPEVASFYVTHNGHFYVNSMHSVGILLRDAEKLRTEWATGRKVTRHEAEALDRRQTNSNAFVTLLERAQKKDEKNE